MQGCEHLLDGSIRFPTRVRSGGVQSRHDLVDRCVPGEEARGSGPSDALDFIPGRGIILVPGHGKCEHLRWRIARVASAPSKSDSGRLTSATSGRSSDASSMPERPFGASAITSMSGSLASSAARPLRKRSLPATIRTRIRGLRVAASLIIAPFLYSRLYGGGVSAPVGR
jgi:hypothetical protein